MIYLALSYLLVIPLGLAVRLPRADFWLLTGMALAACISTLVAAP